MSDDPPIGWLVGRPGEAPMTATRRLDDAIRYAESMARPDFQGFAVQGLRVWSLSFRQWVWPRTNPGGDVDA